MFCKGNQPFRRASQALRRENQPLRSADQVQFVILQHFTAFFKETNLFNNPYTLDLIIFLNKKIVLL